MKTYHKIQSIFKRDMANNGKIMEDKFALPEIEWLKNNEWIFTEKVDGTNIRIMWEGEEIKYGGKTDNAQLHIDLIENLHKLFDSKIELFREMFIPLREMFIPPEGQKVAVCFYGEGYGAGIQKGGCYREDKSFVLFDIKIGNFWLNREDVEDIANKFGIDIVPIVGSGTIKDMVDMVKKGFNSQWGDFLAEGIVAKPKIELFTRRGDRLIAKIKHKDFIS